MMTRPGLLSSHVAQAWLDRGNRIAGFWTTEAKFASSNLNDKLAALASGAPTMGEIARRHDIPVRHVESLSDMPDLLSEVRETGADTLLTVMTRLLIPRSLLDVFGRRAVNVHPALLPKYQGKQPCIAMLYDGNGDQSGGVTLHRLTPGIDEGPIIAQRAVPWSMARHYDAWVAACARAAGDMAGDELMAYLDGDLEAVEQNAPDRYYRKIAPFEFVITPDKPLAVARRLFECAPGWQPRWGHSTGADSRTRYVQSIVKVLGPPTGQPPLIKPLAIEADIADARIRMKRGKLYRATMGQPFVHILAHRLST